MEKGCLIMSKKCIARLVSAVILSSVLFSPLSLARETLNVYTYRSFVSDWGPGPGLQQAFESLCECRVNFVSNDDGVTLLNRLRLEGAQTRVDVILGLDNALLEEARQLGLVQPHGLTLADYALKPELAWEDEDFIPYDYGYFAFIYDARRTEPVTSMQALLDSSASVIYQDPRTSTPGQGLVTWMRAIYGDQAPQAWQQLRPNTVTVTKGWSEAYSLFLQGEADYVLSYTTSPAYHLSVESVDHYRAAHFAEGHPMQIEVAAISRHSQRPELAQAFLDFLLSPEAQAEIATKNWMLPVREDVSLPSAFSQLIQPQSLGFSAEELARQRLAWVREWRSAVSQ